MSLARSNFQRGFASGRKVAAMTARKQPTEAQKKARNAKRRADTAAKAKEKIDAAAAAEAAKPEPKPEPEPKPTPKPKPEPKQFVGPGETGSEHDDAGNTLGPKRVL